MNLYTDISQKSNFYPDNVLIQWHITEKCNLRCTHCYHNGYSGNEKLDSLLYILAQIEDFIDDVRKNKTHFVPAHITITGGEPMVSPAFWDLIDVFHQKKKKFGYSILTNGTYINGESIKKLASLAPYYVQISIEGSEQLHDSIRGEGNFKNVCKAARLLVKNKITTSISFTAHAYNYKEFPAVARIGRKLGVNRVWTDRLIPYGTGSSLTSMNKQQTKEYIELIRKSSQHPLVYLKSGFQVSMLRALQFIESPKDKPYRCVAGEKLITIGSKGEILPCRRMPIDCGNLFKTSLLSVYQESPLFRALRNPDNTSSECKSCLFSDSCRGGLKCLSYAVEGSPFVRDPGCWFENL